jgi:hypothetical protein
MRLSLRLLQVFLAVAVLLIPATPQAQPSTTDKTCTVRGRIADPMDAAINRAFILVHSDAWVKLTQQVTSHQQRRF